MPEMEIPLEWYLIVMTIFLVTSVESHCVKSVFCEPCWKNPNGFFRLDCQLTNDRNSGLKIFYAPERVISIQCDENDPPWSMYHFEKNETLSYNVRLVHFLSCALPPTMPLNELIEIFVSSPITELALFSSTKSTRNLSRSDFIGMETLTRLALRSSQLTHISVDLLEDLTNLNFLEFYDNRIEKLHAGTLNLPELLYIDISYNYIETLEPNLFDGLPKLIFLNLGYNLLTELSPSIFRNLISLHNITLAGNNIKLLDSEIFSELKILRIVNLDANNFTERGIPQHLFRYNRALESVSLSHNKRSLHSLPRGWLMNRRNLLSVSITYSGLVVLPRDLISGVRALQNITLSHNKIRNIPGSFLEDCAKLEYLSLDHNEITHLPIDFFQSTPLLISLDLSNNQLKEFDSGLIDGAKSLQILRLQNNEIQRIHEESQCFKTLRNSNDHSTDDLVDLRAYCPIALSEVYLDGNKLSIIPRKMIVSMDLKILQLDRNEIRNITLEDFEFFQGFVTVSVRHNQIETISMSYLKLAEQPQKRHINLILDDNPMNCDCRIHGVMKMKELEETSGHLQEFSFSMSATYCANPAELRSLRLNEIDRMSLKCLVDESSTQNTTCPKECRCWDRPEDHAYLIDCSYKNLLEAPESLQSPEGYHIELNLTGNFITSMPLMTQPGYLDVTRLILSNNNISRVNSSSLSEYLQALSLDSNNLTKLETPIIEFLKRSINLTYLELHKNPWICNCDTVEFLKFIQEEVLKYVDLRKVTCELLDDPMFQIAPEDICPVFVGFFIIIGTIVGMVGIIAGTIAAVYYRYQREIKIWLYAKQWCLWFVTEDEIDKGKKYDAFLSFSHLDDSFVTQTLIPTLEEGPRPFRLCVHYRDWIPGEAIPTQIVHSVENSKRTIVVLSPNFLKSVWSRIEFKTAHERALSEGRARLIIILLEGIEPTDNLDVELKAYLKLNTYVKWGDPWFWEKLKYALPHPGHGRKRGKNMLYIDELWHEKVQSNDENTGSNSGNQIPDFSTSC